jgi:hypothetical protein
MLGAQGSVRSIDRSAYEHSRRRNEVVNLSALSAIELPHWLMLAGAVLVVFGFIGFALRQNGQNRVAEGDQAEIDDRTRDRISRDAVRGRADINEETTI